MTLLDILGLGGIIDTEKRTIELKFLGFSINGIKYSSIKELVNDNKNTEKLLSEFFTRRQVMWQDFSREDVKDCIESLKDLMQKCNIAAEDFYSTNRDKDAFYATLLRHWGDQCDIAIKDFLISMETEEVSSALDFGTGSRFRASEEIPRILGEFRSKTLPLAKELTKLLPEENIIRIDVEKNIDVATNMIIRNYNVPHSTIVEGQYNIQ